MAHPHGGYWNPSHPPTVKQKRANSFFWRLWRRPTHSQNVLPQKVRCGPATSLQPGLPSHGLHRSSLPSRIVQCSPGNVCSSDSLFLGWRERITFCAPQHLFGALRPVRFGPVDGWGRGVHSGPHASSVGNNSTHFSTVGGLLVLHTRLKSALVGHHVLEITYHFLVGVTATGEGCSASWQLLCEPCCEVAHYAQL